MSATLASLPCSHTGICKRRCGRSRRASCGSSPKGGRHLTLSEGARIRLIFRMSLSKSIRGGRGSKNASKKVERGTHFVGPYGMSSITREISADGLEWSVREVHHGGSVQKVAIAWRQMSQTVLTLRNRTKLVETLREYVKEQPRGLSLRCLRRWLM